MKKSAVLEMTGRDKGVIGLETVVMRGGRERGAVDNPGLRTDHWGPP